MLLFFQRDEASAGQQLQRDTALVLIWFSQKSGVSAHSDLLSSPWLVPLWGKEKKNPGTVILPQCTALKNPPGHQAQGSTVTCSVMLCVSIQAFVIQCGVLQETNATDNVRR